MIFITMGEMVSPEPPNELSMTLERPMKTCPMATMRIMLTPTETTPASVLKTEMPDITHQAASSKIFVFDDTYLLVE